MQTEYTFTARLAALVGICIALTVIISFIPHEFSVIRSGLAFVEFIFMAATMTVTMKRVLEDY